MANERVLTGALAIIKVNGTAVGKMRNVRINESFRRVDVPKGLGSIFDDELALVKWSGSVSCSFFEINYKQSGIENAVRRAFGPNIFSQIASGIDTENFEDQAVLDLDGVDVDVFKKLTDVIDPNTGLIKPKATPYAVVRGMFIESDNVNVDEGNVSGRDQQFRYLYPVTTAIGN